MVDLSTSLENLASKMDMLVIFTDCDREGEYIGYEISSVCSKKNPAISVKRAYFSSLSANEITRSLLALRDIDMHIVESVKVRIELDLRTGSSMTRLQTMLLKNVVPNSKVISYGPCQFPTLGFIVEQYIKASCFVKEVFFYIELLIPDFIRPLRWERGKIHDKNFVTIIHDSIKGKRECRVLKKSSSERLKYKPYPLRTVELQKAMSSIFKMSSHKSMQIAEKLYNGGYLSYPRTETDRFDEKFEFRSLITILSGDNILGNYASNLLESGLDQPRKGKNDDKAHPPIHPLKCGNNLTGDEKKLFEYVARRFLACFSKNAKYLETKLIVSCGSESFSYTGNEVLCRNYLDVFIYDKFSSIDVPNVSEGQVLIVSSTILCDGQTSPPVLLNESELINIMDKNGIGTDATIHEHIQKIQERNYVVNLDGRFVPTSLGIGLVLGYDMIFTETSLTKPKLRAGLEKDLQNICSNICSPIAVRSSFLTFFETILCTTLSNFQFIVGSLHFYENSSVLNLPTPLPESIPDNKKKLKPKRNSNRYSGNVSKAQPKIRAVTRDTTESIDIRCNCQLIASNFVSNKDGTKGRKFFVCGKKVFKCRFFKWAE